MDGLPAHEELTDGLFETIANYVYEHARINLTEKKRELVRARLGKVIRTEGYKGYRDFYNYMTSDDSGRALRTVLNAVSTNLTFFFRENKHFEYLAEHVLPERDARARAAGRRRLRLWSAGCSSGEEPYSMAITLLEHLSNPADWDARILATDIDTDMIARAAEGIYPEKRFAEMPKFLLRRYFRRDGREGPYQAVDTLRRIVTFRYLNLMDPWPFRGRFDCIFCRNVMIYFDKPTQEALVNRFYDALEPGGYLFIGHSEGLTGIRHRYRYMQPTIYRKPA